MQVVADLVAGRIEEARRSMGELRFGHGLDLDRCCVRPILVPVAVDGASPAAVLDCWIVLEENPGAVEGYSIVYDAQGGEFGLAVRTKSADLALVGWYGSFKDALEAM